MINLLLIPYMAAMYRLRGHSLNVRPFGQAAYAVPYAYATWLITEDYALTAIGFLFAVAAVLKGHGHNMDMGTYNGGDYEWYEKVFGLDKLHGKIDERLYDFIGISVSGLTYTAPVGIICLNPILAVSGALKGIAYLIGKGVFGKTEYAEWLTGALAGLSLFFILGV